MQKHNLRVVKMARYGPGNWSLRLIRSLIQGALTAPGAPMSVRYTRNRDDDAPFAISSPVYTHPGRDLFYSLKPALRR